MTAPTAAQMMGWISDIVAQGVRRPGYPADSWTERWASEMFTNFGLEKVRLEPVPLTRWDPEPATLQVWTPGVPGRVFGGFPLPYSAPTAGLVAELARLDAPEPVVGKVAVSELAFAELPAAALRGLATAWHDPAGEFDTLTQTLPFGPQLLEVMEPAMAAGAAGFVGLLTGVGWETSGYYVPYDAQPRPIPGLWLSGRDGRELLELLSAGPVSGRLTAPAGQRVTTTHNVVGTLPGRGDEWVIVASHHDGPWASAVEDGSGVALVLAQAAYWSGVPADQRPHNLLFLLTSGHLANAAGTASFIERHAELLPRVVLEVHLEHAARRAIPTDGVLVPTADPEVRWWFTSRNPSLEAAVLGSIRAEGLGRSFVLPPDVFFPMPPTDGAYFHTAGVPLMHFLSAPPYLFDPGDTLAMVHEESLVPITRAVARVIAGLADTSAASMRAGVVR